MTEFRVGIVALASALSLMAVGCGGGSSGSSSTQPQTVTTSGQNVASVAVNGGPTGNYVNGIFTSVTVCVPSSSTCQTIPNMLVDTGSVGIRILSSVLTVALPAQTSSGGPVAECLPFVSGFAWGPVDTADVEIGEEKASAVPVHVLNDLAFAIPTACSSMGGPSLDTLEQLGAYGILGVGLFAQDCGGACAVTGGENPGLYYQCPSSGCVVIAQALAQQVPNPVAMFASDNNGLILELPAVNGPEATLPGSLVFGIGTESNNALGSATVYTVDDVGNFTTNFENQSYTASFLDSGSNGYFFPTAGTSGLAECTVDTGFYCPASTENFSATNQGANGATSSASFSVANAESLFTNNGNDAVFNDLGGPGSGGFDWGLPFFFGRNVFVAIEGKSAAGTTGPYWAF